MCEPHSAQAIDRLFAPLVPACASFAAICIDRELPLLPGERVAIARACPKRRRTFAAGRACARRALGLEVPIGVGRGGAPCWPSGFVGSIAHTDDAAVAVASQTLRAIGIDIESLARAATVRDLLAIVTTAGDVPPACPDAAAIVFSAKESVYKCLFPIGGRLLEHADIDLAFGDGIFEVVRAEGHDVEGIRGRFAVASGFVATVAFREQAGNE